MQIIWRFDYISVLSLIFLSILGNWEHNQFFATLIAYSFSLSPPLEVSYKLSDFDAGMFPQEEGVGGQKNRLFVNFYTIENVNGGG